MVMFCRRIPYLDRCHRRHGTICLAHTQLRGACVGEAWSERADQSWLRNGRQTCKSVEMLQHFPANDRRSFLETTLLPRKSSLMFRSSCSFEMGWRPPPPRGALRCQPRSKSPVCRAPPWKRRVALRVQRRTRQTSPPIGANA